MLPEPEGLKCLQVGERARRGPQDLLWDGNSVHGLGSLSGTEKADGAMEATRNHVQDDRAWFKEGLT